MIILCDIDGVVAALDAEWCRLYNEKYDDTLTVAQWGCWDLGTVVKPECGEDGMYALLSTPGMYQGIKPIPGARRGVEALKEMGHRVVFVTSCYHSTFDQKREWLVKHGFIERAHFNPLGQPGDLVAASDKTLCHGDLLIDDRAATVKAWVDAQRSKAILFEQPWNKEESADWPSMTWLWVYPAPDWAHIVNHLKGFDRRLS